MVEPSTKHSRLKDPGQHFSASAWRQSGRWRNRTRLDKERSNHVDVPEDEFFALAGMEESSDLHVEGGVLLLIPSWLSSNEKEYGRTSSGAVGLRHRP